MNEKQKDNLKKRYDGRFEGKGPFVIESDCVAKFQYKGKSVELDKENQEKGCKYIETSDFQLANFCDKQVSFHVYPKTKKG